MNIDELLKSSMKDFKPDAPDVWSSINGQLGQAAASKGIAAKIAAAVKGSSVVVKVALVLAVPAVGLGGFITYKLMQQNAPKQEQVVNVAQETPSSLQVEATQEMQQSEEQVQEKFPEQKVTLPSTNQKNLPQNISVSKEPESTGLAIESVDPKSDADLKALIQSTIQIEKPKVPVKNEQAPKPRPKIYNRGESSNDHKTDAPATIVSEEVDQLEIPNVFTPFNNDGKNDRFVIPIKNEKAYHLRVYDEKEQMVFESFSKENTWDGHDMRTGLECEDGLFTYIFIYELNDNQATPKRGTVKLIR